MADDDDTLINEKLRPRGAEFVPPFDDSATAEQIGNFWMARGKWDESQKANLINRLQTLDTENPNEAKLERSERTKLMRTEIRRDVARDMSPEEMTQRYGALGMSEHAKEFQDNYQRRLRGRDEKGADEYRIDTGVRIQEIEDRRELNSQRNNQTEAQPENELPKTVDAIFARIEQDAAKNAEVKERGFQGKDGTHDLNQAAPAHEQPPEQTQQQPFTYIGDRGDRPPGHYDEIKSVDQTRARQSSRPSEPAPESSAEKDKKAKEHADGDPGEMTEAKQARLDKMIERMSRESGSERSQGRDGPSRGGRGSGRD